MNQSKIGEFIAQCRKEHNMTQMQFAEKLGVTNKAVSKWERAESIPDVFTLKEIVDIFGVTMDYLLESEHKEINKGLSIISNQKKHNHLAVTLISTSLIFLIATFLFVYYELYSVKLHHNLWLVYMYAIPVSCIVLLVFNSIWGKRKANLVIISLLIWSVLSCVYLSFLSYNIWLIFTIGIPAQFIIFFSGKIKSTSYNSSYIKNKKY